MHAAEGLISGAIMVAAAAAYLLTEAVASGEEN